MSVLSKNYDEIVEKLTSNSNYFESLSINDLKDLLGHCKQVEYEYNNLQLIVKRNANSLYGTSASNFFSLVDYDLAEDITTTGRLYACAVDTGINMFFVNWGERELKIIQEFYPDVVELKKFDYVPDTEKDICVYGDTDSRYIGIDHIYDLLILPYGISKKLPPNTEEGNIELAEFVKFIMDKFINKVIKDSIDVEINYRNAVPGYLKMAHEVTARNCIFQGKKKYVMSLIWKDGKQLNKIKLKTMGVELKKGETNKKIKRLLSILVDKYLIYDYNEDQLRAECFKIINYIKQLKNKEYIYRISSVSNLKQITFDEETKLYKTEASHIQMKMAVSWMNHIKKYKLDDEYKHPFEGQKMFYYYDVNGYVIAIPDDVDINTVPYLPEPDWNLMLKQILIKPIVKYINKKFTITDTDIENFILGIKPVKIN